MYHVLETYLKNKVRRQKGYLQEIMSKVPDDLDKQEPVRKDMAILRASIIAEMDAANLYEQFASQASDPDLREILLHVANEEKHHVGEFQVLLERIDPDYTDELEDGAEEVDEVLDGEEE